MATQSGSSERICSQTTDNTMLLLTSIRNFFIQLPFVNDLAVEIVTRRLRASTKRTFREVDLVITFRIRQLIVQRFKDKLPEQATSMCLYQIRCSYSAGYIGQTSRWLYKRIKEHLPNWSTRGQTKKINSAILVHLVVSKHQVDVKTAFKVLYRVPPSNFKQLRKKHLSIAEDITINIYDPFLCRQKRLVLKAHQLPLTNVAFDKCGKRIITGSYDRTCKLWDTESGQTMFTLEGHKNVVYCVAFNLPYSDKIATGSFDKSARIWDAKSGVCLRHLQGHTAEVVCLAFSPTGHLLATGSMDTQVKVWDVEIGSPIATLSNGHSAEIISIKLGQTTREGYWSDSGRLVLTGSFDHTACLWDLTSGRMTHKLTGHQAELSNADLAFNCRLVATSSMDKTVRLWDIRHTARCLGVLDAHTDEVLDVQFDLTGRLIASASADSTSCVWQTDRVGTDGEIQLVSQLTGHQGEVNKVCFNSQSSLVLTASTDKTARLWQVEDGQLHQSLDGHSDEVVSCSFNYESDLVLTGSKDNTCRVWR